MGCVSMNEFEIKKPKRKHEVVIIRLVTVLVSVIVLICVLGVILTRIDISKSDVRYKSSMIGGLASDRYRLASESDPDFDSFESVEAIISPYRERSNLPIEEIVRFETESCILLFLTSDLLGFLNRPITPIIIVTLINKGDDGILHPVIQLYQGVEADLTDTRGIWYDEDRVARDIVIAYVHEEVTSQVNEDIPIYYGVGVGNPPSFISISSYEPDDTISFEYRGNDYYFWYYLSAPQFGEMLSDNIDIESFKLEEVIELFDIRVVK